MDSVLIWIGLLTIVYLLWRLVMARGKKTNAAGLLTLPSDAALVPQPLLTSDELLLYNLVRMAVQDHYLVFARVPLLSVMRVDGEGPSRLHTLRRLALKHLDFVLVHPGSRMVEQVVQFERGAEPDSRDKVTRREIQMMVQAAGIRMTTLKSDASYTVQQLEDILGVRGIE